MNFQLPFNELGLIEQYKFQSSDKLQSQLLASTAALHQCYGYSLALPSDVLMPFMRMMHMVELKNSFELEGMPIAYARLFEALGMEAQIKDKTIQLILAARAGAQSLQGLKGLELDSLKLQAKTIELYRHKTDQKILSYYTNLCLYTPPSSAAVLEKLKQNLHQHLLTENTQQTLEQQAIIHFQIRAVAPFVAQNGIIARQYALNALQQLKLDFIPLPISLIIQQQKEHYNALIKESLQTKQMQAWIEFYAQILQDAAQQMHKRIGYYLALRKSAYEQMNKYLDYVLPSDAILKVLFEQPYINAKRMCKLLNCHRQTAYLYLTHLCKLGLLIPKKMGRETLYLHKAYFDLLVAEPII
jgi:Fic family protein